MTQPPVYLWKWPLLLCAIAVGFGLRIWNLDAVPLRGDEAFAASYWAGLPLAQSLATIAPIEPHPPLTYAIFRLWGIVVSTNSEFALRMLPALSSVIGIALVYALTARLFNPTVGTAAALLLAVNPSVIWHARDFRNYALWSAGSLVTAYLGWRALTEPHRSTFARYALSALVVSLTFYFELLFVAAIGFYGLFVIKSRHRVQWVVAHAVVLAAVVAVFVLLQGQLFSRGGYAGNTALFHLFDLVFYFPGALIMGDAAPVERVYAASFLAWIVIFLTLFFLGRFQAPRLWLLCLIVIPMVGLSVVGSIVAVFTPRYVLPASSGLIILLAAGLYCGWHRSVLQRVAWSALFIGGLLLSGFGSLELVSSGDYAKSPDWRAVRRVLANSASPSDIVVQTTADAAFGYYVEPLLKTIAIPFTPTQTFAEVDALLRSRVENAQSVWLFEHSLYPWENARLARQWLDANMQAVYEMRVMGVPLVRYLPLQRQPWEQSGMSAQFGSVQLTSARVEVVEGCVAVWLYWDDSMPPDLTRSIQIIGAWNPTAASPLWLQSDVPMSQVHPVRDVHRFDVSTLPEGSYDVIVKLYNPTTNAVVQAKGADYVSIGSFVR